MNWIFAIGSILGTWTMLRMLADERASRFDQIVQKVRIEPAPPKPAEILTVSEKAHSVR